MQDLENKNFILTGAKGQLGLAISRFLKTSGANVIGFDLEDFNLKNKEDVLNAYKQTFANRKKVDGLINNAGASFFEDPLDRIEENFDETFNTNLKGLFNSIQSFVKCFDSTKQSNGSIVNIASIYGFISPHFSIYSAGDRKSSEIYGATKAGVIQMTKYFCGYLSSRNIRTNCISPGGIYNPQNPQSDSFIKKYSKNCPMERLANSEEIAGGVAYLLSDISSYTNGHNLIIDGGYSCW